MEANSSSLVKNMDAKLSTAASNTGEEMSQMADNVYAHLNDEISRAVFGARRLFAMDGDVAHMTALASKYRNLSGDMERYAEKMQKGQHVYLYGVGRGSYYLASRMKYFGVIVDAMIDPDGDKGEVDSVTGIRIISEKTILENKSDYADKTFILGASSKKASEPVIRKLRDEVGVAESNILQGIYDWRNNASQYFDFFEPKENEVFVDCGCFDGGTCYRFVGWCGRKGYEQIYSFEADPQNVPACRTLLENLGHCELFPYGVSNCRDTVYFASDAFETSCIISKEEAERKNFAGVEKIETISLDEVLAGKRITFLKMDIEGAEYEALLGAEKLIRENHPRMAISVYHKPWDFVTLADLILKIHPDYRISFRHYSFDDLETIMYVE